MDAEQCGDFLHARVAFVRETIGMFELRWRERQLAVRPSIRLACQEAVEPLARFGDGPQRGLAQLFIVSE